MPVQKYWTVRRLCGVYGYATHADEDGYTDFKLPSPPSLRLRPPLYDWSEC
jgi:hypothetical protein